MSALGTLNHKHPVAQAKSSAHARADGPPALSHPSEFARRHIGPDAKDTRQMLDLLGYASLEALRHQRRRTKSVTAWATPSCQACRRRRHVPAGQLSPGSLNKG